MRSPCRWLTSAFAWTALLVTCGVVACGGTAPPRHEAARTPAPSPSPALTAATVIDDMRCGVVRRPLLHFHAHLAISVLGQGRTVPYAIGVVEPVLDTTGAQPNVVDARCYFDLHTHGSDGIIHIESSEQRDYTLGQFFDMWGQRLSSSVVGADTGQVTAYLNGAPYVGDPREIPLQSHAVVQLDVGDSAPPMPYTFPEGL